MKLKVKEVAAWRLKLLAQQGYCCALCRLPCTTEQAVLDHDHTTGAIRAALHRSCNALLGKLENNHKRYGIRSLAAFCNGVTAYLQAHATNRTGVLHPTHKTAEEKRERVNARARARRAAKTTSL